MDARGDRRYRRSRRQGTVRTDRTDLPGDPLPPSATAVSPSGCRVLQHRPRDLRGTNEPLGAGLAGAGLPAASGSLTGGVRESYRRASDG